MVKLTPELINSSMQYINPCRDRELDLRGKKNLRFYSYCIAYCNHQNEGYVVSFFSSFFILRNEIYL